MRDAKLISVLTPCFNEEAGIRECYERVRDVFERELPQYDHEHVFIDNCSSDRTVDVLREIAACDPRVKVIVNSRNFGLSRSPYYGMLQVTGAAVVPLVADLQTPPDVIPELVERWEQGFRMVIAVRTSMRESLTIRACRKLYYAMLERMSNVEQIKHFIGFGLFDRRILDILRELDDPTPYFRGLVSELGFEKAYVRYNQPARRHGKSKHTFWDLLDLAILGLTSHSKVPLRMMTVTGTVLSLASLLLALGYFVVKLVFWNLAPFGVAPLLIGLFFFASVQLLFAGLLGEYVGAIYDIVRRRPLVIEQERINFDGAVVPRPPASDDAKSRAAAAAVEEPERAERAVRSEREPRATTASDPHAR